jgi:uncharacterized membrane protein YoaK (UPF0700 family)
MIRYRRRYWLIAAALSALAGFVDAIGYVQLGGYFVSFMSGNSTRLGVGLAGAPIEAALAAGLICAFVAGAMLGALTNRATDHKGGTRVLVTVCALLALSALLGAMGAEAAAVTFLALAMGAVNNTFQRDGEVSIGVTYMTGTLVRLGQRLAGALTGGPRWAWTPYLLLWIALIVGAVGGAASFSRFGFGAIWFAAAAAGLIAIVFARMPHAAD